MICAVHQEDDPIDGRQVVLPHSAGWKARDQHLRENSRAAVPTAELQPPPGVFGAGWDSQPAILLLLSALSQVIR